MLVVNLRWVSNSSRGNQCKTLNVAEVMLNDDASNIRIWLKYALIALMITIISTALCTCEVLWSVNRPRWTLSLEIADLGKWFILL